LKQLEKQFFTLVENSTRDELAQCAKYLAMYLVLYRQKFGEIPSASDLYLTNLSPMKVLTIKG